MESNSIAQSTDIHYTSLKVDENASNNLPSRQIKPKQEEKIINNLKVVVDSKNKEEDDNMLQLINRTMLVNEIAVRSKQSITIQGLPTQDQQSAFLNLSKVIEKTMAGNIESITSKALKDSAEEDSEFSFARRKSRRSDNNSSSGNSNQYQLVPKMRPTRYKKRDPKIAKTKDHDFSGLLDALNNCKNKSR